MTTAADYRVGLVGDFSGGGGEDVAPAFRPIDLDSFDAVMAAIAPRIRLGLPFLDELEFRSRGEFHPDSLIERVPTLAHLASARRCVGDPAALQESLTAAGVSLELAEGTDSRSTSNGEGAAPVSASAAASMDDGDLLDDMLGAAAEPGHAAPSERAGGGRLLDRAIREILADSGAVTDFSQQDRWRDAIDEALSDRLRAILHHPAFRALESSWIAAFALVRAAAAGEETLQLLIADAPQAHLQREIEHGVKISESHLKRSIDSTAPVPGELGLDLLVTDYAFQADARGLQQLARLTELTEAVALPLLASAAGSAVEPERASEQALAAWQAIARRPGAHLIGLCAPRILMRVPYAPDADAIETLDFDERAGPGDAYTWAGAATGVARAALRARATTGDVTQIGRFTDLEGLPIHVWSSDGEKRVTGPVDVPLTEARLETFALMGLMPVTGVRGTDTARILSLRSLAGETLIGFA